MFHIALRRPATTSRDEQKLGGAFVASGTNRCDRLRRGRGA